MLKNPKRWHILFACVAVMLLAAGCFQQVGDASQPFAVSQGLATETPLPTETPTETVTPTPSPTPDSTAFLLPEETEEPFVIGTVSDQAISDFGPTSTPAAVAQNEDPFSLTATEFVRQVTVTVEVALTQTAQAEGIGATPTDLPPVFTPTASVPAGGGPTVPGGSCVHEVVAGENLFRLSLRYGVPVMDMAAASGITNINLIRVGQRITIPGCGTTGVFPPPTSVSPDTVGGATGGPLPPARSHVVQQYETLFEISLLYGVPVASIAAANGISNINLIYLGQTLAIPGA